MSEQERIILQYLENSYTGARMLDDISAMTRIARAIEAFEADPTEDIFAVEPTLYGYKIEHLAYIASVMEKEGVTAEYAVRTFDDMERVIKMVIEEARAKIEEAFNG